MPLTLAAALALAAAFTLAACVGPTGTVLGDWHGIEDTYSSFYYARIEIILDGVPAETGGTYHYIRLLQAEADGSGTRYIRWTDRWTSRIVELDGHPVRMFHLHDVPNGYIRDYALLSNGGLLPIATLDHPDLSANAVLFALAPEPRDSFGFGRP